MAINWEEKIAENFKKVAEYENAGKFDEAVKYTQHASLLEHKLKLKNEFLNVASKKIKNVQEKNNDQFLELSGKKDKLKEMRRSKDCFTNREKNKIQNKKGGNWILV
jgi:hypothetical protein